VKSKVKNKFKILIGRNKRDSLFEDSVINMLGFLRIIGLIIGIMIMLIKYIFTLK